MIGVRVLSYRSSKFEYKNDRLAKLSGYLLQVLPGEERIVTVSRLHFPPSLRTVFRCPRLALCTVGNPSPSSMGRSQSRVIGEVVAPVALLSGIALSPESRLWYGRHRRKTVISLRSPSLALLGVGSTPSPSAPTVSSGGHVTANRQFVAVLRHTLLWASVSS